jgi:uncharacterized protein RhaS with RHS repeats
VFTYPKGAGLARQTNYTRVKALERFHHTSNSTSAVCEPVSKVSAFYDESGHKGSMVYDVRIDSGSAIKKTLPLGQYETFEYDKIGSLIGQTDVYLGNATCHVNMVKPGKR